MKITWVATERVQKKAIRASILKEQGLTYKPLSEALGCCRSYAINLKQYGDQLRKEQREKGLCPDCGDPLIKSNDSNYCNGCGYTEA
jgi:hypothetical protein